MKETHWHVLGAGSIGCLFAADLSDAGCPVTLLTRNATAPTLDLAIESDSGTRELRLPASNAMATRAMYLTILIY